MDEMCCRWGLMNKLEDGTRDPVQAFQTSRLGFHGILLALYIGIAPVYWFAGIDPGPANIVKTFLVATAVVAVWLRVVRSGRAALPFGMVGPPGMVLVVGTMSLAVFQSEIAVAAARLTDVAIGFAFLWTVYLYVSNGGNAVRLLGVGSSLILPFCLLVVSSGLIGIPNWPSPFLGSGFSLADSGFGGTRTGWAAAVSMYLPMCLMAGKVISIRNPRAGTAFSVSAVLLIAGSQLVVGGRTGLLASLLILTVWIALGQLPRWGWALPLLIAVLLSIDSTWIVERLRFDRLSSGVTLESLDRFSASRLTILSVSYDLFRDRPFLGYGFDNVYVDGLSIHNGWLRLGVEGGVLAILGHIAVAVSFCLKPITLLTRGSGQEVDASVNRPLGLSILLTVAAALVVSLFEPGVFFGTFQIRALVFAGVGAASALFGSLKRGV